MRLKLHQVLVPGLWILKASLGTCPWTLNTESFTRYLSLDSEYGKLHQVLVPGLWIKKASPGTYPWTLNTESFTRYLSLEFEFTRKLWTLNTNGFPELWILKKEPRQHWLAPCCMLPLNSLWQYSPKCFLQYRMPLNSPLADMYIVHMYKNSGQLSWELADSRWKL